MASGAIAQRRTARASPLPRSRAAEHPAYRAAWLTLAAATPIAGATLLASGMRPVVGSFLPLVGLAAALAAVHLVYDRVRPDARIALGAGLFALLIGSGVLAALISHAGMRLALPLIDPALAAADAALGVDTPGLVRALAAPPGSGAVLGLAYAGAFPAVLLAAMLLAWRGREERAWELGFCFSACIVAASVVAVFLPALGSTVHHGGGPVAGLPTGAGDYHLPTVAYFRDGADPSFDLARVNGVVTFPSFHMVMALLVPWALRGEGWPARAGAAWCALIAASTIAIGGHYVVDLIAGAGVWAAAAWAVRTTH